MMSTFDRGRSTYNFKGRDKLDFVSFLFCAARRSPIPFLPSLTFLSSRSLACERSPISCFCDRRQPRGPCLILFSSYFLTDSAVTYLLHRSCRKHVLVKVLMMMDEARESCEVGVSRIFLHGFDENNVRGKQGETLCLSGVGRSDQGRILVFDAMITDEVEEACEGQRACSPDT